MITCQIAWKEFRSFLNSIFKTLCFSALCFDAHRPVSGKSNANHAFKDHANDAITL